ncbi:MAG: nucleotidyltransferase domain-containing protein [Candidatus Margulisiibacteriota bacterium]|jgi:predicted nucleotidyltransferase
MDITTTKNLEKLLANKGWVRLAFLFGSEAKNRTRTESDVDVAIWPEDNYKMDEFNRLWREIEQTTGKEVDLVRLNEAKPTVAWAAFRGIPLLIRDKKFFIDNMLTISDEAEFMQGFVIDLWNRRKKRREEASK